MVESNAAFMTNIGINTIEKKKKKNEKINNITYVIRCLSATITLLIM